MIEPASLKIDRPAQFLNHALRASKSRRCVFAFAQDFFAWSLLRCTSRDLPYGLAGQSIWYTVVYTDSVWWSDRQILSLYFVFCRCSPLPNQSSQQFRQVVKPGISLDAVHTKRPNLDRICILYVYYMLACTHSPKSDNANYHNLLEFVGDFWWTIFRTRQWLFTVNDHQFLSTVSVTCMNKNIYVLVIICYWRFRKSFCFLVCLA